MLNLEKFTVRDAVIDSVIKAIPQCYQQDSNETSIECLATEARVPRSEALRAAKVLQQAGYCRIYLGRRGKPTRLVWTEPPVKAATPQPMTSDAAVLDFSTGRKAVLPIDITTAELWELFTFAAKKDNLLQ